MSLYERVPQGTQRLVFDDNSVVYIFLPIGDDQASRRREVRGNNGLALESETATRSSPRSRPCARWRGRADSCPICHFGARRATSPVDNMADFAMGLTARELGIVSRGIANAAEAHQHVRKQKNENTSDQRSESLSLNLE